jgi:hypothetical protein
VLRNGCSLASGDTQLLRRPVLWLWCIELSACEKRGRPIRNMGEGLANVADSGRSGPGNDRRRPSGPLHHGEGLAGRFSRAREGLRRPVRAKPCGSSQGACSGFKGSANTAPFSAAPSPFVARLPNTSMNAGQSNVPTLSRNALQSR